MDSKKIEKEMVDGCLKTIHDKLATYPASLLYELITDDPLPDKSEWTESRMMATIDGKDEHDALFREYDNGDDDFWKCFLCLDVPFLPEGRIDDLGSTVDFDFLTLEDVFQELERMAEHLRTYDEYQEFVHEQTANVDERMRPDTIWSKGECCGFYVIREVRKTGPNPMRWTVVHDFYPVVGYEDILEEGREVPYSVLYDLSLVPTNDFLNMMLDQIDMDIERVNQIRDGKVAKYNLVRERLLLTDFSNYNKQMDK